MTKIIMMSVTSGWRSRVRLSLPLDGAEIEAGEFLPYLGDVFEFEL
jgi:hypothetical protein